MTKLINQNVISSRGSRTSMRLEQEFWTALDAMASYYGRTRNALVSLIDESTRPGRNERTSAIRVEVLKWALGNRSIRYYAPNRPRYDEAAASREAAS